MSEEACKHEWLEPLREEVRPRRYKPIWQCGKCREITPRENVEIFYSEHKNQRYIDTADDIRVINILSNNKGITRPAALELLKSHKFENPLELDGEFFWTE